MLISLIDWNDETGPEKQISRINFPIGLFPQVSSWVRPLKATICLIPAKVCFWGKGIRGLRKDEKSPPNFYNQKVVKAKTENMIPDGILIVIIFWLLQ